MIEFIRFAIIIIGCISMMLGLYRRSQLPFDKLVNLATAILVIHAAHALCAGVFFADRRYIDTAAPFGLMYGPLLFFGLSYSAGKKISRRTLFLHCLPFLLYFPTFLLLVLVPAIRENILPLFLKSLYMLLTLSFLAYALWGCFYNGGEGTMKIRLNQKIVTVGSIILLVMAGLFFTNRLTKDPAKPSEFIVPIIYLIMLIATFMLLLYNTSKLMRFNGEKGSFSGPAEKENIPISEVYIKSAVAQDVLETYEKELIDLLEIEKIYLDPKINLSKTALRLKISQHHLSQVVNQRFDKNFSQLINSYRITYACALILEDQEKLTLEEVAFRSGFSSRISFNRNFKLEKECSPTEYRKNFLPKVEL